MENRDVKTTTTIGIIGGGLAGLMAYCVLRFRGIPKQNITVYSPHTTPEAQWEQFVRSINQTGMRSESIAHFLPTDSPGLATLEAVSSWSLKPLIKSWFDRYNPTVDTMISHMHRVARLTGFFPALIKQRIAQIQKTDQEFTLYNDQHQVVGQVNHIILAVGHGQISIPEVITKFQATYPDDSRVRHAFTHPEILPASSVVVLGDGLSAATQWISILQHGGTVIAVSRDGFSFGQPLNTPRKYFSRRGIDPYRQQSDEMRAQELRKATRGTVPTKPLTWMRTMQRAIDEHRLIFIEGTCENIDRVSDTLLTCTVRRLKDTAAISITSHYVVAATGFQPVVTNPLLAQLVATYTLATYQNFIKVDDSCRLPELSSPTSAAFTIGPAAIWAVPCADSIGGMKIVAHRIADSIIGAEKWRVSEVAQKTSRWLQLLAGHELA